MLIIKPYGRVRANKSGSLNLPEGTYTYTYAASNVVGTKQVSGTKHKPLTYAPVVLLEAKAAKDDLGEARVARELSPLIADSIDRSIQALKEADAFVQDSNRVVDGMLARLRESAA